MNKVYPLKQATLTGLISAVFATTAFSVTDSLNQHNNWNINPANIRGIVGLLSLIILGIGIYVGMQNVKRANQGRLSYGQALLTGCLIALTVGIIMAILGLIYSGVINPGYAGYMVAEGKKVMLANGESPGDIAKGVAGLQKQFAPSMQIIQALVGQTAAGMVISLVLGIFVKSKK
jgi:hypothetical protein